MYFEVQNNIIPEDRDGATNLQHDILVASADLCVADSLDPSAGIVALIYECFLEAIKLSYKHSVAKSDLVAHSPLTSELQSYCSL